MPQAKSISYIFFFKAIRPLFAVIASFFIAFSTLSCSSDKPAIGDKKAEAEAGYSVYTEKANILVSDSGITQYKIKAQAWYIYDRKENPRWYFPQGFFAEQVDASLKQKAYLQCDTAYYYTDEEIWVFIGHVKIQNRSGDTFTANSMTWEKENRTVFSLDTVTIHSGDRMLRGTGFKSNQEFTRYTFYNNIAVVDVPEEEQGSSPTSPLPSSSPDTLQKAQSRAQRIPRSSNTDTITEPESHLQPQATAPPKFPSRGNGATRQQQAPPSALQTTSPLSAAKGRAIKHK